MYVRASYEEGILVALQNDIKMKSRYDLYYDAGNNTQLNIVKFQGDINLNQGVSIAFFCIVQ